MMRFIKIHLSHFSYLSYFLPTRTGCTTRLCSYPDLNPWVHQITVDWVNEGRSPIEHSSLLVFAFMRHLTILTLNRSPYVDKGQTSMSTNIFFQYSSTFFSTSKQKHVIQTLYNQHHLNRCQYLKNISTFAETVSAFFASTTL